MQPVNHATGVEAQEIKAALNISSRSKSQCPHCPCGHGVVMFLVRLHILAKVILAVTVMINCLSGQNRSRTQRG